MLRKLAHIARVLKNGRRRRRSLQQLNRILREPQSEEGGLGRLRRPSRSTRIYRGVIRSEGQCEVWFEDPAGKSSAIPERHPLSSQLEVRNHSPTGFAWGYSGSGPAQLALALLVDALGDSELALVHYQEFKREQVSKWGREWVITAESIQQFVTRSQETPQHARFPPGRIVSTPAALRIIPPEEMLAAIRRHLRGDWGELDQHDWDANNRALRDGTRLLSAYNSSAGERFWIITEADRSVTTLLLPQDY